MAQKYRVTQDIYADDCDCDDCLCIPKGAVVEGEYLEARKQIWVEYKGEPYALSEAECEPVG
jgi:hypothetical protein